MMCNTDVGVIPITERQILFTFSSSTSWSVISCFLGVNTSPEISYSLSVLSCYLTKDTPQDDIHTKHLLCYVWNRRHVKLTWWSSKVNPPFETGQFHSFIDSSWVDGLPSHTTFSTETELLFNCFFFTTKRHLTQRLLPSFDDSMFRGFEECIARGCRE